jgi:PAS domain S-box-containing protein
MSATKAGNSLSPEGVEKVTKPLRILLLEDIPADAELNERMLRKAGIAFDALRVDTLDAFAEALETFRPDLILADFHLPGFDGMDALSVVRTKALEIPFVFVSGAMGEELAVESIKQGATDYILKDRLSRLPAAVQRALEEKQQLQQRREAEEKFRKITESAQEAIIMMGNDQCISFWNKAAERIFGYTAAEAVGQGLHLLIATESSYARFTQAFLHFQASGEGEFVGKVTELTALRKGGKEIPVELSLSATHLGGQWHAIGIVRDITERKRAEKELQDSEARYRRITDGLTDYLYTVRIENGRAVETTQSPACVTVTGYTAEEFAANPYLWIQMVAPEDREMVMEHVRQILAGKDVPPMEHHIIRKDGKSRWVSDTTILFRDAAGKLLSYDGVIKDITERKQAEIALNHANRALATLSVVNRNLVRATNEDELLLAICQAIVEQRGYRMAWVGYAQQDADKPIKIMAHAGHDEGYLDAMQLSWAEAGQDVEPCRAIRDGATQLCQDIAKEPYYPPWRDAALKRGYAASITLPLTDGDGMVFGVLTVYAEEVSAFSVAEADLLEEMAGDLAFGVRSLHIRHERDLALEQNQKQLEQLQHSLEDTVQVIATIVEKRDPYTAGHQARVADLAAAIAGKMGLPEEQVHAIHLASVVHDLGKIQIPAEILSKPGRLNDIEYSFIKIHPQSGYEILKNISFPWQIAQMVLQHHERLDGSGYPLGAKGDEIILEARILSVADVVEAMSSHRPYRPGLGVEAALEEITRQRGITFDTRVVDACLSLFREEHYSLPD